MGEVQAMVEIQSSLSSLKVRESCSGDGGAELGPKG